MQNATGTIVMLLLVAAAIGAAVLVDAPLVAVPVVFLILVLWGGGRMASARGRTL
jgi:hypothetical protein